MRVLETIGKARNACRAARDGGKTLGLVPTMGALHEGHLTLVRAARASCDVVAASIFVNPTQFGPNEDLARYPRSFEQDCRLLEAEGVELVFAPSAEEIYPSGAATFVTVEGISDRLDGASRPGHFRGVATVVSSLFHIIEPDLAFFGQKDAAQVAVLRRMVRDQHFGVELIVCPTVREPDGLALSSRNRYLSDAERRHALVLSRALRRVEEQARAGVSAAVDLIAAAETVLATEPGVRLDYFSIVDPETLEDLLDVRGGALVAVAAFVGTTRLIDNILLQPRET